MQVYRCEECGNPELFGHKEFCSKNPNRYEVG
jgi:hypothetical protein